jgi:hypothetical protein
MTKTISAQQILGERGVALVSQRVHEMGFIWRANTVHDAGVDGHIELRDPGTGAVSNKLLQVQVKATDAPSNERTATFDFRVNRRDLEYWLRGNLPVILVVTIPDRNEAFWLAVRERAYDERGHLKGILRFHKQTDHFQISCREQLALLVQSAKPGYYEPAPKIRETLVSNLLPITHMPEWLYVAPTEHRTRPSVFKQLQETKYPHGPEWLLTNGVIISAHDLTLPPYNSVCDAGSVDPIRSSEWSTSSDEAKRREFVQLLSACLRAKTHTILRYQHERPIDCLYFLPTPNNFTRSFRYRSAKLETSREVVTVKRRTDKSILFIRHNAFKWRFFEWDEQWYLELTPTYLFTSDGWKPLRFYEDYLKGIKRLERNNAVGGQLQMWAALLTGGADLLDTEYTLLTFRSPVQFDVDFGLNELDWEFRYGEPEAEESENQADDQGSFALL